MVITAVIVIAITDIILVIAIVMVITAVIVIAIIDIILVIAIVIALVIAIVIAFLILIVVFIVILIPKDIPLHGSRSSRLDGAKRALEPSFLKTTSAATSCAPRSGVALAGVNDSHASFRVSLLLSFPGLFCRIWVAR